MKTRNNFIEILKRKNIDYILDGEKIIITDKNSYVNLNGLTIPSDIVFNNKGYTYLVGLTSMSNNIVFNNKGDVYLNSLTSLPSGTIFNNQGFIYLPSLTSLPSDIVFNNNGTVWLNSLKTMPIDIKVFDIYGMKINNTKQTKGYTIYDCNYLGNKKHCFVAEKKGFTAHGKTVKKAIEDVEFKIISEKVENEPITLDTIVDVNHYRMITGACELGTTNWLKENNLKKKKYMVSEILPILEKTHAYGVDRFKELIK